MIEPMTMLTPPTHPVSQKLASTLEKCLAQIRTGDTAVADCPERLGSESQELQPLLAVAVALWTAPKPALSEKARARIAARMWQAIPSQSQPMPSHQRLSIPLARWHQAAAILVTLMVLMVATTNLVAAASHALPGSPLYGVKRTSEQLRLWVTPAQKKPELHLRFAQRRLAEFEALQARGRFEHTVLRAMSRETGVVLDWAEASPLTVVQPFVDEILATTALQQASLMALKDTVPASAQEYLLWALQANAGHRQRAEALVGKEKPQKPQPRPTATLTGTLMTATAATATVEPAELQHPIATVQPNERREPTNTSEPTYTTEPAPALDPTATFESTETPQPTLTASHTQTPQPSQTPQPTEKPKPTHRPQPTKKPKPTKVPKPIQTFEPTETPEPTQTPDPT